MIKTLPFQDCSKAEDAPMVKFNHSRILICVEDAPHAKNQPFQDHNDWKP